MSQSAKEQEGGPPKARWNSGKLHYADNGAIIEFVIGRRHQKRRLVGRVHAPLAPGVRSLIVVTAGPFMGHSVPWGDVNKWRALPAGLPS